MKINIPQKKCFMALATTFGICLAFGGCGKAAEFARTLNELKESKAAETETESTGEPENQTVSFEAYIKEGETFSFSFEPEDVVSYEELRNAEFKETLSLDNWDQYFEVREVHLDHMEYDKEGQETQTYMKGDLINIMLKEDYWYVDNWTQNNGVQLYLHIVGEETRAMHDEGTTYLPNTRHYNDTEEYSGDDIIILKDFYDSWDERTQVSTTGSLDSYEMVQAQGEMYLLDASVVEFKKYKDDIYYFAAYGAPDEYFVIFVQTDDEKLDRDKEYVGTVYKTYGWIENERLAASQNYRVILKDELRDCLKLVNERGLKTDG